MADTLLPFADDGASALFYNPAAISSFRGTGGSLLDLTLEANNDFVSGFAPLDSYKVTSLSAYAPTLESGQYPGVGYSLFPNFTMKGLALGVLLQTRVAAKNEAGQVSYRSSYRLIPTIGTGVRLANGLFRIGYSLQFVNKAEGEITDVPITSSPLGYNQQLAQGSAVSHNVGATITLPISMLPTFTGVLRNVGGATYRDVTLLSFARNSSGLPANEPMTMDVAFGLTPRVSGGSLALGLQLKDAGNSSGFSIVKKSSFGMEYAVRESVAFRLGYGVGTGLDGIHAGFGFRGKRANLNFAWSTEEVGTPAASELERRWFMQYQLRVF